MQGVHFARWGRFHPGLILVSDFDNVCGISGKPQVIFHDLDRCGYFALSYVAAYLFCFELN
jgi:hypothetical protein